MAIRPKTGKAWKPWTSRMHPRTRAKTTAPAFGAGGAVRRKTPPVTLLALRILGADPHTRRDVRYAGLSAWAGELFPAFGRNHLRCAGLLPRCPTVNFLTTRQPTDAFARLQPYRFLLRHAPILLSLHGLRSLGPRSPLSGTNVAIRRTDNTKSIFLNYLASQLAQSVLLIDELARTVVNLIEVSGNGHKHLSTG